MATATWKRDARKFGRLFKFGQWESALLVARSVQRLGSGPGRGSNGRATVSDFASIGEVSDTTVQRYYDTWQKAAKDHLVPDAKNLGPNDEPELPAQAVWTEYYREVHDRHPERDLTPGQQAIAKGLAFNAALELAIEDGMTAEEAREIDEVLADTHDLLKKVMV